LARRPAPELAGLAAGIIAAIALGSGEHHGRAAEKFAVVLGGTSLAGVAYGGGTLTPTKGGWRIVL
jgi:hypothetical protein